MLGLFTFGLFSLHHISYNKLIWKIWTSANDGPNQMRRFRAIWAIFRDPWALFFLCFIYCWALFGQNFYLVRAVFGPSLFTNWRFFTKLWALFHPKHLVTLTRDCSKVEVMLINALNCFRIVRRREELHPDFPDPGHVGRHPAAVQVSA